MSATHPKRKLTVISSAAELDAYIDELQHERRKKGALSPPQDARVYEMLKMNKMSHFEQPFTEPTLHYRDKNNGQTVLHVVAKRGMIEMFQQKISYKHLDTRDY